MYVARNAIIGKDKTLGEEFDEIANAVLWWMVHGRESALGNPLPAPRLAASRVFAFVKAFEVGLIG